jgi:hypothetical protein
VNKTQPEQKRLHRSQAHAGTGGLATRLDRLGYGCRMQAAGPSWSLMLVGAVFILAGAVGAFRPALAWRVRKVADEADRGRPPTSSGLMVIRVIGCVLALVGIYAVVSALLR